MKKPKINAIISEAISKASVEDFTEGAFRAMVLWLYNWNKQEAMQKEFEYRSKGLRMIAVQEKSSDPNSWIVIPEEVGLKWKTQGSPGDIAEAIENIQYGIDMASVSLEKSPYGKTYYGKFGLIILGGVSSLNTYNIYLLNKEAGNNPSTQKFIVDEVLGNTTYCKEPILEYGYDHVIGNYIAPLFFNYYGDK